VKIPFFNLPRQNSLIEEELQAAISTIINSGQQFNGGWSNNLKKILTKHTGIDYCVLLGSGTQALECIAAYGRAFYGEEVDRVFIPALTYQATAAAYLKAGWDVGFIDVDDEGLIRNDEIERVLETTGPNGWRPLIVSVGLYGNNRLRFNELLNGQTHDGAQDWVSGVGQFSRATAISFDPTKNLASIGNGGAIITTYQGLADFAEAWNSNGPTFEVGEHCSSISTNSRMSEIDAASVVIKYKYLAAWQERRRKIAQYLVDQLANTRVRTLVTNQNIKSHALQKFVIDVDDRDSFVTRLRYLGIQTRVHYATPLPDLPMFQHCVGPVGVSAAYILSRRVLSLPIYPELTDTEVEYIASSVIAVAK